MATKLATILHASTDYQTLLIKSDSQTLVNYQNNKTHIIDSFLAKRKTVSVGKLNLQVQYQLNFIGIIEFLTKFFLGIITLSLLFVFISARLNYKLQFAVFRVISKQISNELAQINDVDFITKEKSKEQLLDIIKLERTSLKQLQEEGVESGDAIAKAYERVEDAIFALKQT